MITHVSEQLAKLISAITAQTKNHQLIEFIKELYGSVSADDLNGFDPIHLYKVASSTFEVLKSKTTNQPIVQHFNDPKDDNNQIIQIVNLDAPFLVDSISNELKARQIDINLITHAMLMVKRDKDGKFIEFSDHGNKEYVIQIHIPDRFNKDFLKPVIQKIIEILECVNFSVNDWHDIKDLMQNSCTELDNINFKDNDGIKTESIAFLEWLIANHFVFLGSVSCDFSNDKISLRKNSKLGLLKSSVYELKDITYFDEFKNPEFVVIRKWDARSIVHRTAHMDVIIYKQFNSKGNCIGGHVFFGLFTSSVYYQSVRDIPLMRLKVRKVIDMYGYPPASHNCKELVTVLESFPRGELLQMDTDELFTTATEIVSLTFIPRVKVFLRKDRAEKFVSCIIFIPEKKFSTDARINIENIICKELEGIVSNRYVQIGDSALTRLQLIVRLTNGMETLTKDSATKIESEIIKVVSNWNDELYSALIKNYTRNISQLYFNKYKDAFQIKYQSKFSGAKAIHDIKFIEEAISKNQVGFDIYIKSTNKKSQQVHLKIYSPVIELTLSSTLPLIENLGLKAVDVETYEITVSDNGNKKLVYISHYRLFPAFNNSLLTNEICEKVKVALCKVWAKTLDDDSFNSLIITCNIDYRQANLIRAYVRYLRQTKYPLSMQYTVQVLLDNPHLTKKIVELFELKFDPNANSKSAKLISKLEETIKVDLISIKSINEDRAIRSLLGVVAATLRTNYYQQSENKEPKSYVSFKLNSSAITELPLPKPYAEIFVYSSRFEGIHLRGGKIARGGLRWSDRPEDFRTEVLGLAKAQMTKNSVIVPVGSKGGFVLKSVLLGASKEDYLAEGIACYQTFLRGLLDITDNIVGGKVVPPPNVIRLDSDDPYLVVAADKGTASFSDYANEVSKSYNFWLHDAFASGGSAGYDHKKMAITAKGSWISVLRHFEDMGIDINKQEFTCTGIGDMSGDVFGNGMLLSNKIKLVAAFNHAHIFLDPSPDPLKSFKERERLFNKPGSQWSDYNLALISKGGAIFDRKTKSIGISNEVKSILQINSNELAPDDLIQAILKAPVDLLWNGGIGTYVKAKSEANERIGDRANDNLRINGSEVRAKIIGEGGNLGCTQLGRIEYAKVGGRINTDFIDNSAGVDCSDHEVNIKIALSEPLRSGKLKLKDRDKLLEKMTDQVANLVLADNFKQTQIITLEQQGRYSKINSHSWLIKFLENNKELDRSIEFLPSDEELQKLINDKQNLTRPELAVLLAYAKNSALKLFDDVDISEDKFLHKYLFQYFPPDLTKNYSKYLEKHKLRKEIIATLLVNDFINLLGCTFFHQLIDESSSSAIDIIKAFVVVKEVFEIENAWAKVEQLGTSIPLDLRVILFNQIQSMVGRNITWLLNIHVNISDVGKTIDFYKSEIGILHKILDKVITADMKNEIEEDLKHFDNYPNALHVAREIAKIRTLKTAFDIIYVSKNTKYNIEQCAHAFFLSGDVLHIRWLIAQARSFIPKQYLQILSVRTLINELHFLQMQIVSNEIKLNKKYTGTLSVSTTRKKKVDRLKQYIKELMAGDTTEVFVSKLTVAIKYIKEIANQ